MHIDYSPLRDVQRAAPAAFCRRCRGEIYTLERQQGREERPLCDQCWAEEEEEKLMTLMELSLEYRAHAQALQQRLGELRQQRMDLEAGEPQLELEGRIHMLETMLREARELAVLTARYYERGYRRNAKYTL